MSPWQVLSLVGMGLLLLLAILAGVLPNHPLVQGPVTAGTIGMVFVGVNVTVVVLVILLRVISHRRSRHIGPFVFVLGNFTAYLAVHFLFGVQ